jgi:hypothetical protein
MRTHSGNPSNGGKHYGRQHAQTAELYRQRREARASAEQESAPDEIHTEPLGGEAPPAEEPVLHTQRDVETVDEEQHADSPPDEATRERLRTRAQQAVTSVLRAARQAARKAAPLEGAKKLADTAMSGVRRVAREVSARKSHSVPKE